MTPAPEPQADDRAERAENVFAEWLAFRDAPDAPDGATLVREHPALASELLMLLEEHDALQQAVDAAPEVRPPKPDRPAVVRLEDDLAALAETSPRRWPYADEQPVGGGSFGRISEAREPLLGRRLALKRPKVARPAALTELERQRVVRVLEEARLLARLDHPAIVPLHSVSVDEDGLPCLVMRFVEGLDFGEVIRRGVEGDPRWTLRRRVVVLRRVCEAMASAHAAQVVHRDLKPDNVRVGPHGEVHVMDWGLGLDLTRSRRNRRDDGHAPPPLPPDTEEDDTLAARITQAGTLVGTPAYMAPEQWRADLRAFDERTDVYALGALLVHLLTGETPEPPPFERLVERLEGSPRALVAVAERAMAADPADRFPSAAETGDALQRWLDGDATLADTGGEARDARTETRGARRSDAPARGDGRRLVGLLVVLLVLLGIVVAAALVQNAALRDELAEVRASVSGR